MSDPTFSSQQGRSLVLASASPRRRELLAEMGLRFEVLVAKVREFEDPQMDPREMVTRNSQLKADWVAQQRPEAVVLGADTTVFIDGHALNKPADLEEARRMLRRLSGRSHTVYTGLCLVCRASGLRHVEGVASEVRFRSLDEKVIEAYLKEVNVLDKAGSYAIQEKGDMIIEGYEGSYTNIVGLPVERTKQILGLLGLV